MAAGAGSESRKALISLEGVGNFIPAPRSRESACAAGQDEWRRRGGLRIVSVGLRKVDSGHFQITRRIEATKTVDADDASTPARQGSFESAPLQIVNWP